MINTWSSVFNESLQGIWLGTAAFLPKLIVAVLIFIIGWVFGSIIDRVITQILRSVKIDNILKSARIDEIVTRAGYNLDTGKFIGGLIKWFVVIVFLVASLEVVGLTQVNSFLQIVVLTYLPRVIVAAFILIVGAVIADVLEKVVMGAAKAAEMKSAKFASKATRWAIWAFSILAALSQLNIADAFFNTLFTGIIVAISLALGLSFGLGGQEAAGRLIEKVRQDISNHSQ